MDRLACVDLHSFPLQLLVRRHPDWRDAPVAVVADDRPQAPILWVNERARAARILPGQRYAHALGLARDLRAAPVPPDAIAAAVAAVADALRTFSPDVEASEREPGVFWLGGAGLGLLFPSVGAWARAIRARLRDDGYAATVVVGFSRFATYAVARAASRPIVVFRDRDAERAAAEQVPLDRLDLEPRFRDTLAKLGVHTVGGLLRLPPGGLLERFGPEAFRLHELAAGERWDPLRAQAPPEAVEQSVVLDDPETDADRLAFAIKRALDPLLAALARHHQALTALVIDLTLDRHDPPERREIVCPAEPTLDARALLRLVHLRLEGAPPPAGVVEIRLTAASRRATREQLALFRRAPRRDLRAADEAFARLRAEFGNDAVVCARLCDAHLPEARYAWVPLGRAVSPSPAAVAMRPLVRRIQRPVPLVPPGARSRDDGALVAGGDGALVDQWIGPFVVSGGWWRAEVQRDYYFAQLQSGELLWVYYDRRRRRWYVQGAVQ